MAAKLSTGLQNYLLGSGALDDALTGGTIKFYSGSVPASANDAVGTLLVAIDDAVAFGAPSAGIMALTGTLDGTCAASGTATYFRIAESGDAGGSSTTLKRIQGTVGVAGADCNMTNPVLVVSAPFVINAGNLVFPSF